MSGVRGIRAAKQIRDHSGNGDISDDSGSDDSDVAEPIPASHHHRPRHASASDSNSGQRQQAVSSGGGGNNILDPLNLVPDATTSASRRSPPSSRTSSRPPSRPAAASSEATAPRSNMRSSSTASSHSPGHHDSREDSERGVDLSSSSDDDGGAAAGARFYGEDMSDLPEHEAERRRLELAKKKAKDLLRQEQQNNEGSGSNRTTSSRPSTSEANEQEEQEQKFLMPGNREDFNSFFQNVEGSSKPLPVHEGDEAKRSAWEKRQKKKIELAAEEHLRELERQREQAELERQKAIRAMKEGLQRTQSPAYSGGTASRALTPITYHVREIARYWLSLLRAPPTQPTTTAPTAGPVVDTGEQAAQKEVLALMDAHHSLEERDKECSDKMWQMRQDLLKQRRVVEKLLLSKAEAERNLVELQGTIRKLKGATAEAQTKRDIVMATHDKLIAQKRELLREEAELSAAAERISREVSTLEKGKEMLQRARLGLGEDYDALVNEKLRQLQEELDDRAESELNKQRTIQRLLKEKEGNDEQETMMLHEIQMLLSVIDEAEAALLEHRERRERLQRQKEQLIGDAEQQKAEIEKLTASLASLESGAEDLSCKGGALQRVAELRNEEQALRAQHLDAVARAEAAEVSVLELEAIASADKQEADRLKEEHTQLQESTIELQRAALAIDADIREFRAAEISTRAQLDALCDSYEAWSRGRSPPQPADSNSTDMQGLTQLQDQQASAAMRALVATEQLSRLERKCEESRGRALQYSSQTEQLKMEREEIKSREQRQAAILAALDGETGHRQGRSLETSHRLANARSDAEEAANQVQALENSVLGHQTQAMNDKAKLQHLQDTLRVSQRKHSELSERATQLHKAVDDLETEIIDMECRIDTDKVEHQRLQFAKEKVQSSFDKVWNTHTSDLLTVEALHSRHSDAQAYVQKFARDKADMQQSLIKFTEDYNTSLEVEKQLCSQQESFVARIQQQETEIKNLSQLLQERQAELQEKKTVFASTRDTETVVESNTEKERSAKLDAVLKLLSPMQGASPLDRRHYAVFSRARNDVFEDIHKLIEHAIVPVDVCDESGNTILLIACQVGSRRIARLMLQNNANLHARNLRGNTCLHCCYAFGHFELAQFLIGKGADESAVNALGLKYNEGIEHKRPLSRNG